jgi:hypothetical protein
MTVTTETTIEGMLAITIAQHQFTLSGTLAHSAVVVEYHADFADSITLGTLTSIAGEVGKVFGVDGLADEITQAADQLKNLPVSGLVTDLLQASVRITDLVINTATQTYGIGIALDFSASPPTLFGIELDAIGFKVSRSKTTTTTTGNQ